MSLTNSLIIGRSALSTSQMGIQVAGDNLANAATEGYHRRVARLSPVQGFLDGNGLYHGLGVQVDMVQRQVDAAVERRLRDAIAHQQATRVEFDVLSQLESITNPLSGTSMDDRSQDFFNAFSELANNPGSFESRALIVEQGDSIAGYIRQLRSDLTLVRDQVDLQLETAVNRANVLAGEISEINQTIASAEQGVAENPGLRDKRDSLLGELSELLDISITEQSNGAVDVFVGSTPIVIGSERKTLGVETVTAPESAGSPAPESRLEVVVREPAVQLRPTSGRIGALLEQRNGSIDEALDDLDSFASALIYEVNRIHIQGSSSGGLSSTTGAMNIETSAQTISLNDPTNGVFAGLPFGAENGYFEVMVTDTVSGATQTVRIDVDLDGIDSAGAQGFGDDTSLQSIVNAINAQVPNVNASINTSGQLSLDADAGFTFGFGNDTSGVLALIGVNTFFTGSSASDIDIRQALQDDPTGVVAGFDEGSNETALGIAGLRELGVTSLSGTSLLEHWRKTTERIAVETSASITNRDAAAQVRESMAAQRQAVSGVSVDEESINLITFQRQYQAAARLITTVDELTQILIDLV
ncbi:MAG: flagellar hook-associated protein FlgK [Planctomycetota bacterium]|jgi:flagellar hook-associated protein 1 FlgK